MVAQTGSGDSASQDPEFGANPQLILQTDGGDHYKELPGKKESGREMIYELTRNNFSPNLPECLREQDIKGVYLQAPLGGSDGWYVASITTYVRPIDLQYTEITSDPSFEKWVDYDEDDARLIRLSSVVKVTENCLFKVIISAMTGNYDDNSGFSTWYADHKLGLRLNNNQVSYATLSKSAYRNQPYNLELDLSSDFSPPIHCIQQADIKEVFLKYGGTQYGRDSWLIASIKTSVTNGFGQETLSDDPNYNHWLYYGNGGVRILSLVSPPTPIPSPTPNPTSSPSPDPDTPKCGYGTPVCECNPDKAQCIINLEIDEIRTFTSYRKFPVEDGDGIFVRGAQGVVYEINDDGEMEYLEQYKTRHCAANFNSDNCSDPQFVDGKTYRMAIGVNGQIPGPTIIVHDGQMITINVHNNMSSEGISIHWHGMHQAGTPWMDGVGQITQCQIGPSSSFSYIYEASPSGSFWYHSHSGAQRTDGFYGALIVKETETKLSTVKMLLGMEFEDHPDKHTISLLDWQHESSLDLFSQLNAGLGFYQNVPIGEIPPNDAGSRYESTRSYEEGEVGPVPYYSGLINGKGRHNDVPYVKTRLSTFPVVRGKSYRFRLIGAQGLYAYKFSVDGHKLVVVNTDGYWTRKTEPADYVIIHTGERYDFILTANSDPKNYWIRAETLEIDRSSNDGSPPYKSLGHVAEAILQYTNDIENPPEIPSTEYQCIKSNSPLRKCSPNYNTDCFNVNQLQLLQPTPADQLPDPLPEPTVQQALRVKWRVFGVFVCFDLYFVNYRSWQAEILQECAEGCIQGDLQKKIRQT